MRNRALCSALLLALSPLAAADSFTYRGQLLDGGVGAEGGYDLQFQLYADREGRQPMGSPIEVRNVQVKAGQFAAAIDLPESTLANAWLEVSVRSADEVDYWTLPDRSAIALKGATCPTAWELGGNAGTLSEVNFLGTTDDQPLVLRSNNQEVALFRSFGTSPSGATANVTLGASSNTHAVIAEGTTIAGGNDNAVNDSQGSIGGGESNRIGDDDGFPFPARWGTIAGGRGNIVLSGGGFIGGGGENRALGSSAAVVGGSQNSAEGQVSTVGGGNSNSAIGNTSTVAGGASNRAQGTWSTISGGASNIAGGNGSVVPGGLYNCAGAELSWAGGRRAKTRPGTGFSGSPCVTAAASLNGDVGTFVWADSQDADFISSGPDQFLLRARGGVGINAPPINDAVELSIAADPDGSDVANLFLRQRSNNAGILMSAGGATSSGNNDASFFFDHYNAAGGQGRRLELRGDGVTIIRSNITGANSGVSMAAGSGAWSSLSDRHLKTAIDAIDPAAVLDRLVEIPISAWSYIAQGEAVRHMGPMAQDFAAAFGLGENDTTISTIDADGVALAAIQGLNAKLERENAALREEMRELRILVERLHGAEGQ